MAALTGVLAADFSSFYDAVQKAEVSLKSFETGSSKVESQLNRMVDGFSGRRVIQEATLMTEAIEKSGGVTKLTTSELERAGAKASEATEKMMKLGIEVPPGIQKLAASTKDVGVAASDVDPKVNTLRSSFGQFDNILSSLGINIGHQVKGLAEIGDASGKTVGQLGLLGSAGIAAGVGLASFEFTKWIMGWTGMQGAIDKSIESLFAFGEQTVKYTAKMRDAMNAGAQQNEQVVNWTGRVADANKELAKLTDTQWADIEAAKELGATNEDVAKKYHLTKDAIALVNVGLSEYKKRVEDANNVGTVWGDGVMGIKADMEALDAATAKMVAGSQVDLISTMGELITNFDALDPAMSEYIDQLERLQNYEKAVADDAKRMGKEVVQAGQAMDLAKTATMSWSQAMEAVRRGEGTMSAQIQNAPLTAGSRAAVQKAWNDNTYYGPVLGGNQGNPHGTGPDFKALGYSYQMGGPTKEGMAYLHDDEYVVPKGGALVRGGGGGTSLTVNLVVNGSVVSSFDEFKGLVTGAIFDVFKTSGLALPSPV